MCQLILRKMLEIVQSSQLRAFSAYPARILYKCEKVRIFARIVSIIADRDVDIFILMFLCLFYSDIDNKIRNSYVKFAVHLIKLPTEISFSRLLLCNKFVTIKNT